MKRKPVYVEIDINAPMDELWKATQTPHLHEQWDLRFSSITYLPKEENEPQHFSYKRNIGFGQSIEGWGITSGSHEGKNGAKTSSLHFGTDNAISPIKEGKGYWKYVPKENSVTFLTQYDYDVPFGKLGRILDRLLFRPLIGWGTALSFDVLKRWLENGETPYSQYLRFFVCWFITCLFCFIWIYHGLIPKLIYMHPDEVLMVKNLSPFSDDMAFSIVKTTGILEVIFGLFWLLYKKKRNLLRLQIIVFPLLTITAIFVNPDALFHPFNPLTFNISLLFISFVGFFMSKDLPSATTCKRKR
ncbi:DoxX-like family protein [Ureibacillus sp. BA0131]|uniref:DoxX-like family protein n=1 Tax=Ureibacillus aquaedulcis TaxID=3058421 RepID=A0ABT8GMB8_9BACL|nr:DoxX-like family protein [Ureibacillus sp. BA0131]MDN4492552.1 DoxX-like family protein [Ureibacillus sp. BA0131]